MPPVGRALGTISGVSMQSESCVWVRGGKMIDPIGGLCIRDLSGDLGVEGEMRVERRRILSGVWRLYGCGFNDVDRELGAIREDRPPVRGISATVGEGSEAV